MAADIFAKIEGMIIKMSDVIITGVAPGGTGDSARIL
jgi:hypothetical protein